MKKCTICKAEKELSEFNKKCRAKDGLQPHCRECNRERSKAYYERNPNEHKKAVLVRNKKVRRDIHSKILEYLKIHPCVDCGFDKPAALQFDHVRGEKQECVSILVRKSYNWKIIAAEIEKCEVRCANCHALKTAKDFNWFSHID